MPGAVSAMIFAGAAVLGLLLIGIARYAVTEVPEGERSETERGLQQAIRRLEALEFELEIAEDLGQDAAMLNELFERIADLRGEVEELSERVAVEQR